MLQGIKKTMVITEKKGFLGKNNGVKKQYECNDNYEERVVFFKKSHCHSIQRYYRRAVSKGRVRVVWSRSVTHDLGCKKIDTRHRKAQSNPNLAQSGD